MGAEGDVGARAAEGWRASGLYLAHLVDCALHGAAPEPLPEGASWEEAHALAARNGMEGASWHAAMLRDDVPGELSRRWAEMCIRDRDWGSWKNRGCRHGGRGHCHRGLWDRVRY